MSMFSVALVILCQCHIGVTAVGSIYVTLPGNVRAPPVVSVIDGHNLTVTCHTDISVTKLRWSKPGNPNFYLNAANLTMERVRPEHRGAYICTALDNGKNVTSVEVGINVLWSPVGVKVDGPSSALKTDDITFTCTSNGNPEPSYWWSYGSEGDPIAGRGYSFTGTEFPVKSKVYCFVENTLIPTQGAPVTSTVKAWKNVIAHDEASIYDLLDDYYLVEGTRFDQTCKVYGTPVPAVWWTRFGSKEVINTGSRLVVPNIQRNFDGYYTCYAENNITNAAGITRMVTVFKHTYIHVQPQDTSNQTRTDCPKSCNTTNGVTVAQEIKTEKVCGNGVLVALALGWILAVILLTVGLCYFIRTRNSRKPPRWSKHHKSPDESAKAYSKESKTYTPQRPPLPPNRPEEPLEPRHSYMSLRNSRIDRGNPDGSHTMQTFSSGSSDGYLTPKSGLGASGSYVEPYSTSKEGHDSPEQCDKTAEHTYESI